MSTSDPLGVFGPQIRVERHLRTWGHLPDMECGDTGEFGDLCEMPGAERIDTPEPSRIQYEPTSPLAENRRALLSQMQTADSTRSSGPYIGVRKARRERFKTSGKARESRDDIKKRRKQERKNRRKR